MSTPDIQTVIADVREMLDYAKREYYSGFADVLTDALAALEAAQARERELERSWRCFHCGEVFTTPGGAADHFGATPDRMAGCLIDRVLPEGGGNTERGRGLLMALRKAEAELTRLRAAPVPCTLEPGCQCPACRAGAQGETEKGRGYPVFPFGQCATCGQPEPK